MDPAIIRHDTRHILSVNERALELFRCDLQDLVDQEVAYGVYGEEMRSLVRLRLKTIADYGELPERQFPFMRSDGTVFYAKVKTTRIAEGVYESALTYVAER